MSGRVVTIVLAALLVWQIHTTAQWARLTRETLATSTLLAECLDATSSTLDSASALIGQQNVLIRELSAGRVPGGAFPQVTETVVAFSDAAKRQSAACSATRIGPLPSALRLRQ
jgi:hypothetical protein